MAVESPTYAALGQRLGYSPEAARALAKRLRLPRQKANDGKALVVIEPKATWQSCGRKPRARSGPSAHM